jgi:hypothetical protein
METCTSIREPICMTASTVAAASLLLSMAALFPSRAVASPNTAPAHTTVGTSGNIAPGTVLPVALDTALSLGKAKAGRLLTGHVAQDVPLPDGSKIRRGSAVQGHVTELAPASNGSKVTIRFDRVRLNGNWVPIVTNLRAMAGFVTVQQAHVPIEAPGEGDVYSWLPTSQIGGDTVYGLHGPVMSGQNPSKVIGESVPNGVLAKISANQNCRAEIDNNTRRQALWVFSGDACGIYGIEHLKIEHAGRTDPQGSIILAAEDHAKLNRGDGWLLRVN